MQSIENYFTGVLGTIFEIQHGFYTYDTSQFRLDTFEALSSHMWPVATVLASTDLNQGLAN